MDEDPDKRIYVDGVVAASENAHPGSGIGTGETRYGLIGVGSATSDVENPNLSPEWYLHGDLAELMIYHHALTEEEQRQLVRYFVDRYR
jgi:hypothetical protein